MGGGLLSLQHFMYYTQIINKETIKMNISNSNTTSYNNILDHIDIIYNIIKYHIDELNKAQLINAIEEIHNSVKLLNPK